MTRHALRRGGRGVRVVVAVLVAGVATGCSSGADDPGAEAAGASGSVAHASVGESAGQSAGTPAGGPSAGGVGTETSAAETPAAEQTAGPTQDRTDEGTVAAVVPSPTGASVDVVITYATFSPDTDSFEVSGLAAGVLETGGTCTLTLTQPGHPSASADRPAEPDVRDTACGAFVLPRDGLDPGSVTARISYRSDRYSGQSTPMSVDVP